MPFLALLIRWVVGVYVTSPAWSEDVDMFPNRPLEALSRGPNEGCFDPRRREGSESVPTEGCGSPEDEEARRRGGCKEVDLSSGAED